MMGLYYRTACEVNLDTPLHHVMNKLKFSSRETQYPTQNVFIFYNNSNLHNCRPNNSLVENNGLQLLCSRIRGNQNLNIPSFSRGSPVFLISFVQQTSHLNSPSTSCNLIYHVLILFYIYIINVEEKETC